jgi:ribonuclease HI
MVNNLSVISEYMNDNSSASKAALVAALNQPDCKIEVYTDGSCIGNPGPGGWSAVFVGQGKAVFHVTSGESETTNNRMELQAAISVLEALLDMPRVPTTIFTDSQYVKNGITLWIKSWNANGWQTARGKSVKNKDQWQRLHALNIAFGSSLTWAWVRGHNGNKWNEQADALATAAANHFAVNSAA